MGMLAKIKANVKLHEASTKRGLVNAITGTVTLYVVFFRGEAVDVDAIANKAEFWIGWGFTLAGLLGVFLPDEPKTVRVELPPIELQSRPAAPPPDAPSDLSDGGPDRSDRRMRDARVPSDLPTRLERPADSPANGDVDGSRPGWNG